MCGIVGLVDNHQEQIPPAFLAGLRDLMAHRGPDGTGEFFDRHLGLAMRRLAVIDLEHGDQPLTSDEGRVVAFQNGEIYNHAELRAELVAAGFSFRTASDTEVLAHGYACWGIEELLRRLDGMYALAILDRRRHVLHLARDRFGEKPLYYAQAEGRFAYASDLRALAVLPWVGTDVDPVALDRYLALHYVPGEATLLKHVRRVLPGCRLSVPLDDPRPRPSRYYRLDLERRRDVSDAELSAALEQAVASRLVADVPVGVFLSGGLDSSLVATVAARHSPGIATFSMGFAARDYDESPHARRVAEHIGSRHHHFLFDEESFHRLVPEVAAALDEPIGDQALLPLYWLCREARRTVTVVLAGEGADETFAGYSYYRELASSARAGRLLHNRDPITPSGFPLLTAAPERQTLCGGAATAGDEWESDLLQWLGQARDPLQRATAADLATWLPDDLLVKFDRMAMAHGLEGRAPFLEPRLAEIGLGLSPALRMAGRTSKVALRRMASRWLPPEIVERGKHGFILPMPSWLRQWFQDCGGPERYYRTGEVPGLDGAVASAVTASDLRRGVERPRLLFALVALVEWHRAFSAKVAALRTSLAEAAEEPTPSSLGAAVAAEGPLS